MRQNCNKIGILNRKKKNDAESCICYNLAYRIIFSGAYFNFVKEEKMYTLIRKEEKKKGNYEHTFYVKEKPQLLGYTNYRDTTEKFEWKIVGAHTWEWKQVNRNYSVLDYIPILNTIKAFCYQ